MVKYNRIISFILTSKRFFEAFCSFRQRFSVGGFFCNFEDISGNENPFQQNYIGNPLGLVPDLFHTFYPGYSDLMDHYGMV